MLEHHVGGADGFYFYAVDTQPAVTKAQFKNGIFGKIYGGYGYEYDNYPKVSAENFKKVTYTGVVATGLKTYFSKRMYTHIMGGVMYNKTQVNGLPEEDKSQLLPYFEFGLGFQFFKTFPILKSEEME